MDNTMDIPMVELVYELRNGTPGRDVLPAPVAVWYVTGPWASHTYRKARIVADCDLGQWDRTP